MNANANATTDSGFTPLFLACLSDEQTITEIAELLLASGAANVNTKTRLGYTALHRACLRRSTTANSSMQLIRVLLNHGADINAQDCVGYTPLYNACTHRPLHIDVINLLLASNADRYIQNKSGEGPTHLLRGHIREEVVFKSYDVWPRAYFTS